MRVNAGRTQVTHAYASDRHTADCSMRLIRRIPTLSLAHAVGMALFGALLAASPSAHADSPVVTQYTYDAGNNITTVTDPRGLVTAYNVDGLGQLWGVSSPDTGTTIYNYDAYGRRISLTRANGVSTTYGYDALNRVTTVSAGGQTQTFAYDNCTNGLGRLCSVSDTNGSTAYTYTPEGWVAGRGFSIGGTNYSLGYGYDTMGHLAAVTYPDGHQAVYSYSNGVVSGITFTLSSTQLTAASNVTWQPMNAALASWTSSNGLSNTLAYDTDGRLTGISVPGLESLGYSYDAANRLTGIDNALDGTMSQDFGYDDQSRLVSMYSANTVASYGYDANGNRIIKSVNGAVDTTSYSATNNQIVNTTGADSQSYGYDALGNITTLGGTTAYQYDVFNRMNAASGTSYYVNPEGQRLLKTGSAGTTYFAPDANGPLLAENDNGSWVDYVWLGGRLIGREVNGQLEAIHDDQVGRPQVVTNASQAVVWSAQNWPFTRTVTVSNSAPLNLGFPGQYYDAETGLWNNGFRDYDPALGRYVESDPIGLAGGINSYAYAGGNPLSSADPWGLKTCPLKPGQAPDASHEALEPVYPELYVFGIGRLLYAGAALAIPSIATATTETGLGAATAAVGARNSLKVAFRLGFFSSFRIYSVSAVLAKYSGNAAEVVAAAGRTNSAFNAAAAAAAATAVAAGNGQTANPGNCECP
ncbi:MAG: hypothetical protein RSP_20870 [Rhodanobacter sp.]